MSDLLDAGVEIRVGRLFWVGLYLARREYGGPEEGGWFFDQGTLITDPDLYAKPARNTRGVLYQSRCCGACRKDARAPVVAQRR